MHHSFAVGDKVFAKVRGYPAWPAKILTVGDGNKLKYQVYFYGTRETGFCKPEEMFDYGKFKDKFGKPMKKRHFAEALREIEQELNPSETVDEEQPAEVTPETTSTPTTSAPTAEKPARPEKAPRPEKTPRLKRSSSAAEIRSRSGRKIKPKTYADGTAVRGAPQAMSANSGTPDSEMLMVEVALLDADSRIKTALSLSGAKCEDCLLAMDDILQLQLNALMLKKHPEVVETVKKLSKYVGNISEWNLMPDELDVFKDNLVRIRRKAESMFNKFQNLFTVPADRSFYDFYEEEVKKFEQKYEKLSRRDFYAMCRE